MLDEGDRGWMSGNFVMKYPLGLSLHQGLKALTPYGAVTVRGAPPKDTGNLVYIGPGVKKNNFRPCSPRRSDVCVPGLV